MGGTLNSISDARSLCILHALQMAKFSKTVLMIISKLFKSGPAEVRGRPTGGPEGRQTPNCSSNAKQEEYLLVPA